MADIERQQKAVWRTFESEFAAYALILPGDASFVCQARECRAHCCRAFSVPLGDGEVARMKNSSGLPSGKFLESEDGEPVLLPLVQPYLLSRTDGHCTLLQLDMGCGQYDGRPNACRLYPHQLLVIRAGRVVSPGPAAVRKGLGEMEAGLSAEMTVLLMRHRECPGFTGPPLTVADWLALLHETCALQFESLGARA